MKWVFWRARAMENLRPPVQAPATLLNPYSGLPPATSYFFTFVGFFGVIGGKYSLHVRICKGRSILHSSGLYFVHDCEFLCT
jgi:hypothetical protein